jgi:tetratricopeptide (TPR) repeat protein
MAALLFLAVQIQRVREERYAPFETAEEMLYVTSGPALRRLSVAYQDLAADLYWIRAIQHFGGTRNAVFTPEHPQGVPLEPGQRPYALLYPLLDLTTTLDPYFNIAYRFGSIFLAEPYPGGPGRPDLAIKLLQKGLDTRPDKWEYMQDIGFVYYWWVKDYQAASDWFEKAADVPGAPWWLRSLAATTLAEGGDRESSRVMWLAIRESAEIDWLRRDAERRLMQLQALDEIDALQAALDLAVRAEGGAAPASSWAPLQRAGRLRGVPADPTGVPYEIDGAGRVKLSRGSSLFPLPDEPQRRAALPS